MKQGKVIVILLALAAVGLYGAHLFMEHRFCLEHICFAEAAFTDPLRAQNLSQTPEEEKQLTVALNQTYKYLDRGKQSYAFISQDGRFILKFFDFHRIQRRAAAETTDLAKRNLIRQKRLSQLMNGYDIAYAYDRDQGALIFVQLAPEPYSSLNLPDVTLLDNLGVRHKIPLVQTPFVIQRLAVPARVEIASLLEQKELRVAKERFRQIVDMYLAGYQKGIVDDDHNVMYNTGFADGKAMRIDLGRLRKDDTYRHPEIYKGDLEKIYGRIDGWMQRHYPKERKEILEDLWKNFSFAKINENFR